MVVIDDVLASHTAWQWNSLCQHCCLCTVVYGTLRVSCYPVCCKERLYGTCRLDTGLRLSLLSVPSGGNKIPSFSVAHDSVKARHVG